MLYSLTITTVLSSSLVSLCFKEKREVLSYNSKITNTQQSNEEFDEIWKTKAIKYIAHYLRNHKFNEWDHRFHKIKPQNGIGFFHKFPEPKLRSLHWKVHEHCYKDFYKCIIYLYKTIEMAPFNRNDDTSYANNYISNLKNGKTFSELNKKCEDALNYSDKTGLPFDGPQERFMWRVSVSYFMCWFTMRETPDLALLGEPCDNYGGCLDPKFGKRNLDPRAQDKNTFSCALYSFCPDPCCTLKHISNWSECDNNFNNPCIKTDRNTTKFCKVIRKHNQNFDSIMMNKWNITCV